MLESLHAILGSVALGTAALGQGPVVAALAGGTLIGLVFGVLPGISGRTGLILVVPFVIGADPLVGAVFLIALHAVVHTSGSIPAILVGIPTSAGEAATVLDGHALTRRGKAGLALGASLGASVIGGLLGALALIGLMLAFRPIVGHLGQPEILALAVLGLTMVATLSGGRVPAGVAAASLGLMASCVGLDPATGTQRFVFGQLELWDGLDIPALVTGLFVVPELMSRPPPDPPDGVATMRPAWRQMLIGLRGSLRRRWLLLRASLIGIGVGVVPGMGASIAVWLAYGHAAQTARTRVAFGRGAVAGVLAPEAANNAKEGGALAPTLFLGIPGSTGMAIMLVAFAGMGLQPGPQYLGERADFTVTLAATIALANLLALPLCMAATPALAALTIRTRRIATPLAVVAATATTLYAAPQSTTLLQLAGFAALGCAMRAADWPRAPFVLGFVLGPIVEGALQKTVALHGPGALARPGVLIAMLIIAASLAIGWRRQPRRPAAAEAGAGLAIAAILGAVVALVHARRFPVAAGLLPMVGGLAIAGGGAMSLASAWRECARSGRAARAQASGAGIAALAVGAYGAMLAIGAGVGMPLAAGGFVTAWSIGRRSVGVPIAIVTGAAAAGAVLLFFHAVDVPAAMTSGLLPRAWR